MMEDLGHAAFYTAFDGHKLIAQGKLEEVAAAAWDRLREDARAAVLVFSDATGKQMDLNLQGTRAEVLARLKVFLAKPEAPLPAEGPGRPRLGVVGREVSLLPQHWEWLAAQPGGASATLRRLVEGASKAAVGRDAKRQAQERTYAFMTALAGDLPLYEEALRAMYRNDPGAFEICTEAWPTDVRGYARDLVAGAFNQGL